jgi:septal ring factor EnvC (AmiA/AmiB activator)
LSAEAHNEREPYTPAPDPAKENIGETLRRFCSREANKHTELRDEIQELQNQGHAIIDRITKLEEQAAKARRNSDRAQMFLQRPDMFLTLDTSRLHSWMRTMDTSEPQDSSTLQTNGDDGHVDEKRAIVLDD